MLTNSLLKKFLNLLWTKYNRPAKRVSPRRTRVTCSLKKELVCDTVGTLTDVATGQKETLLATHFTGKVYQGYGKIRD